MQVTLTIPDELVEKYFESDVSENEIAAWIKGKVAFEIWHSEMSNRKIQTYSPKESAEKSGAE